MHCFNTEILGFNEIWVIYMKHNQLHYGEFETAIALLCGETVRIKTLFRSTKTIHMYINISMVHFIISIYVDNKTHFFFLVNPIK